MRERACGGYRRHVGAGEHDAARRRRDVAGDQIEHRGFAGAVGADHRQRFAVLDGEVHRVHGFERAVELGHAVELQKDRHEGLLADAAAREARRRLFTHQEAAQEYLIASNALSSGMFGRRLVGDDVPDRT